MTVPDQLDEAGVRPRPRILLVSEFFPASPYSVSGVFQRLQTHLAALSLAGELEVVFLWPEGRTLTKDELERHELDMRVASQVEGRIWFVPVGLPDSRRARIDDLLWVARGAIGFKGGRPTTRSSRRSSAEALARIIDLSRPDLIFAHRLGAGAALFRARPIPRVVLDMDDVEHVRLEQQARSTRHPLLKARAMAWRALAIRAERQLTEFASLVLVCSEADRQKLQQVCPGANVAVLPNTARSFATSSASDDHVVAFIGTAAYAPNREGILWFVDHVWERIRAKVPAARLRIVGPGSDGLGVSKRPGVEVLGFVRDLEPVYRTASLVICPVRRGSGTRVKIIEAALSGRAIVSTTIGAEGLEFESGSEIVLADSAMDFAAGCVALMADALRRDSLAAAARRRASALYSREHVMAELAVLCRSVLADGSAIDSLLPNGR